MRMLIPSKRSRCLPLRNERSILRPHRKARTILRYFARATTPSRAAVLVRLPRPAPASELYNSNERPRGGRNGGGLNRVRRPPLLPPYSKPRPVLHGDLLCSFDQLRRLPVCQYLRRPSPLPVSRCLFLTSPPAWPPFHVLAPPWSFQSARPDLSSKTIQDLGVRLRGHGGGHEEGRF